jgi:hypothetical protein
LRNDDVLDQDRLDAHSPTLSDPLDDLLDLGSDSLALGKEGLEVTTADDVAEGGLGALDEGTTDVSDAESGAVGVDTVKSSRVSDRTSEERKGECKERRTCGRR